MWSDSGPSLSHGGQWRTHKYIAIKNGRYIYPDDNRMPTGNNTNGANRVKKSSPEDAAMRNNIKDNASDKPGFRLVDKSKQRWYSKSSNGKKKWEYFKDLDRHKNERGPMHFTSAEGRKNYIDEQKAIDKEVHKWNQETVEKQRKQKVRNKVKSLEKATINGLGRNALKAYKRYESNKPHNWNR